MLLCVLVTFQLITVDFEGLLWVCLRSSKDASSVCPGECCSQVHRLTCKPTWEDEVGYVFVSVPVKENLQALLGLARSKCGDDTAPALPFTLIDQGQVVIAPKHTSAPNPHTALVHMVCWREEAD